MKGRRWLWVAVLAVLLSESALVGFLVARTYWQGRAGGTAVSRGRAVAERMGCFGCHGPGGTAPIANPGADGGNVPQWTGGTWMMYNDSPADVRSWILNGHPNGKKPDAGALIAMPAYASRLRGREADDLVAYVLTTMQYGALDDAAVAGGKDVATRFGCFGCHGAEGRGLIQNPGSFKGYVPPWEGPDYAELVANDQEFGEWVRQGITQRFRANPAARRFLDRQALRMPAYGDRIKDDEIAHLLAYVRWIRAHPRG